MKSLLKTVVTIYVISKVAPAIIKGVVYITEGAMTGIANKIGKDISKVVFGEEKPRMNLRRYRGYSGSNESYHTYRGYNNQSKGRA